jgi:hypothetical protein
VPACNVQFTGETLLKYSRADISVAVSIPGGLITPIVVDAGNKTVSAIATEMKDLAARARDGKLAPHEYQGGTASLSNMGMYGIKQFEAIINPPQAMIMAIGAGEKRPYVIDDSLQIATVMSATGSFDHRAIDGADGAALMKAFKELCEKPLGWWLDVHPEQRRNSACGARWDWSDRFCRSGDGWKPRARNGGGPPGRATCLASRAGALLVSITFLWSATRLSTMGPKKTIIYGTITGVVLWLIWGIIASSLSEASGNDMMSRLNAAQRAQKIPRIGLAGHDLDACLSVGQVSGLDPQGDNFLAVRAAPRPGAPERDRLGPGREIWICDDAGVWLGVVYGGNPAEGPGDCGVGTPSATVRPYPGPCRWGWVGSRFVTVIAG